jgi:type IV pilus assembly protein PilW
MIKSQHGMTLVELMISLVIGLTVIAGISSLFLQMQKSHRLQHALSMMTDESSYVQEVLQKEIRRTGGLRSRSDVNGSADRIFLPHTDVLDSDALLASGGSLDFAASEYIKGDVLAATGNDAFILRYQLLDANDLSDSAQSNGNSPCTQNALLADGDDPAVQEHVVSVFFYLHNNILSCNAQRASQQINLGLAEICAANCTSTTNFTPDPDLPAVDLINDVEKIAISYGVQIADTSTTPVTYTYYYTDAAHVPNGAWENVVSIRLSVVVKSADDYLIDPPMSYSLNGINYTATDHRLYKTFTTTIALRNRI